MKTWRRKHFALVFILTLVSTIYSLESKATDEKATDEKTNDDIEPKHHREYLRLILVEPLVIEDILKLNADGCVWKDELFWNGSPGEKNLSASVLWVTFSVQFATESGAEFWKSYSFSREEGSPDLVVIDTTNPSDIRECSE